MEKSCWEILGIEMTKDKLAIKKAYAKLAHQISPEDDPEGFRRIHTAYKQAISYASGNNRPPFMIVRNLPVQKREDLPVIDRKKDEDDDSSREDDHELSPRYDFESVTRQFSRSEEPEIREEEQERSPYDFSAVDTGEGDFSDEIEICLERIVSFKEENGIDTADNVSRWKNSTILPLAKELFFLYQDLYVKSDEAGVWNVFFEEPIVVKTMIDSEYRSFLCDKYSEDTAAGRIIWQECDFYRRHVEEKVTESVTVKPKADVEDKQVVFNLVGFIVSIVVLIPLAVLVNHSGIWGRKVFPGLLLAASEIGTFLFFRFFTLTLNSTSTPSPFEPVLTETACFISIMCLENMLYWGLSFSTMTSFSALNIIFTVAGGILGGIVAVFMTLKIRRDAAAKNS